MTLGPQNLLPLLRELDAALLLEDADPVDWIVCGGTALALQGFGVRTTQDIDVLGTPIPGSTGIAVIGAFPPAVQRAIARVAAAHPELVGMGPNWVNLGPQAIASAGLPAGFAERLTPVRIGDRLGLHLPGRADLIAMKLYAASDDLGARQRVHFTDLTDLAPTPAEIESAINWVRSMPDPRFLLLPTLKRIVQELGHEDLADYI